MTQFIAAIEVVKLTVRDGDGAIRHHLNTLHQTWTDAQYDSMAETLLRELDIVRDGSEKLEHLEHRLRGLRERLDQYLGQRLGSQSRESPAPALVESQSASYERALSTGAFVLGDRNVRERIDVRAIVPPRITAEFWHHHGNNKETYLDLARAFAEVTDLIRQGHDPSELAQTNDRYRQAIDAFWSRSDPIRVTKFLDIYVVEAGYHRVAAILELGRSDTLEALVTTMNPAAAP